jgi:EAL domain-containing protein (putative c-di-GMP-specific phosphodiesterase class I)/CheY-like chemotaxis protein
MPPTRAELSTDPLTGTIPRPADPLRGMVRRPRILLVDDDAFLLELQTRMLHDMGYTQTSLATSGVEALIQLEHDPHSAELILCDLGMPDMDGIEFLQKLNQSPFRGSVILLSGESIRVMHSVQKLLGGGALRILGALTKPANREALRALLDCWELRPELGAGASELSLTAEDVHVAMRERQWVLHYQPQVGIATGALVGMEALVRWNHPIHGLLSPDRFIGLAEDCGAIDELTEWVLTAAAGQAVSWHTHGLDAHIAVNVSMQSLGAAGFWRRCTNIVRAAGLPPQKVILEVTESRLAASSAAPLENLVRLRLQRFTLSIDDFGTGHSSLAQLRDIPFSELKIDRGFVHGARDNQIIRPILEGSLGIAARLSMRAVAEGVESQSDWDLLRELGCDFAQGYFISRPMAGDKVWEWMTLWRERAPLLVAR